MNLPAYTRLHPGNGWRCNMAFRFNTRIVSRDDIYIPRGLTRYTPKKGTIDKLEEFLYCPIEFNQDKLSLVFKRSVLDLPIITGNKSLYPVFEDYMHEIKQMDSEQNNSLARTIRRYLMHNLSNTDLSFKHVAEKFNMSERNIQRKLKLEGTSYQQILNNLRMNLAQEYIKEKVPFTEIAFLLGFESQSAFNKFFHKQFHITPGLYSASSVSRQNG